MSTQLNYARMPGPGDWDCPDYVDPLYGEEQAEDDVPWALIKSGEVGEMVSALRGLRSHLQRVKDGREISQSDRADVLFAHDKAVELQRMVDEQLARGESAARADYRADLDREFDSIFGIRRTA